MNLPAMSEPGIANVREFEAVLAKLEQIEFVTEHLIHAGMYARTVTVPAGGWITGALIKIPTVLIVSGDITVWTGSESRRLTGFHVISAAANRKQAFYAHADTALTMLFPTEAKDIEQAQIAFTDEHGMLASHRGQNVIVITDERP